MSFVDRLRPELVRIAPPWRTFADTIRGLVNTLAAAGALPASSAAAAADAVMAREADGSTALVEIGAGVPHARLPQLRQPIVALAVSSAGFYEIVPTVPIRLVALVLSPSDSGTDHLDILAGIATLLRSPELRARLLTATDAAGALAALREHARALP